MKRFNRFLGKLVVVGGGTVLAVAGFAAPASAQATDNLSVTLQVANNCTIATSPVAFGAYDPVVANATNPLNGTGGVTIACTRGAAPTIGLGLGINAAGAIRRMSGGGQFVAYELYHDAGYATEWTNSGGGLLSAGAAPSVLPRNFTVYGRVAGGQDVPANSYADSVVATVNF